MMANIRFVKPPNDNRIRSLPAVGIPPTTAPRENIFITSTAPKISNVIHIATSKQKSYADSWDMFIASRNNNNNNNNNQPSILSPLAQEETVCESLNKYDNGMSQTHINYDSTSRRSLQKLSSNNIITTNQNIQQKIMNSDEISVNNHEHSDSLSAERNNNFEEVFETKTESCNNNNDNVTKIAATIQDTDCEYGINRSPMLVENHKQKDEIKFPLQNVDSDPSDELEEEDKFQELHSLFGSTEAKVSQEKQPMLIQQKNQLNQQDNDLQEYQQVPSSSASPSLSTTSQDRQKQQLSYLFQTGARSKYARSYRPIHRSISDAALIENNRLTSFFKSITEDKYHGLDEEDYDDDGEDADGNLIESGDSIRKNELRRLTQPSKLAWETSAKNQAGNIVDKTKEKLLQKDPAKSPAHKSGEGHVLFSRSLSGDSMMADRLRIRRCALADPENMIMRQEVREKIEREVEKRRSSMVRKISQFFNVHLGLNKEEDLI